MANLAIDGLISGMDTTALLNSLMQVEAIPQTLLKAKVSSTQSYVTALQSVNAKVASLATLAAAAAKPTSFHVFTATTSSSTVTTAVAAGAQPGQLDFTVDQTAEAQRSLSEPMSAWPDSPPVLTIVGKDGTVTEITAASTSLDDMVTAINTSTAGLTATKISVGNGEYRLQFQGKTTGVAGAFTLKQGDSTAGTLSTLVLKEARDAELTLWAGSDAKQTIASSTNTFADLLPGVSVTVSAVSADPVSLTVNRDAAAVSTMAKGLVTGLNDVFALIASSTKVTSTTSSSGTTTTSAGVLAGDSAVRGVSQRLTSAASLPINGLSPSEYGIAITKTGTFEFNADKFAAALAKDPAGTQAAIQEIASRISSVATELSDKYDGTLTTKISSQESVVKNLGEKVTNWDRLLTARRATLEKTYTAMEVQLGTLNTQSSWLTSQLSALNSSSK